MFLSIDSSDGHAATTLVLFCITTWEEVGSTVLVAMRRGDIGGPLGLQPVADVHATITAGTMDRRLLVQADLLVQPFERHLDQ